MSEVQFEECDTLEKMEKLRKFAETFDPPHIIPENPSRILIFKRDGLWIGYAEIVHEPVVFAAWSKQSKPQDIWSAMRAFVGWARIQYGAGFCAVPLDTKNFPQHVMKKLGLTRIFSELYRTSNI